MGEHYFFLAALVRYLPGSGMGFSMRKLWTPHLDVAKFCWQTPHLGTAVCQPVVGQHWLSEVLITLSSQVTLTPLIPSPQHHWSPLS